MRGRAQPVLVGAVIAAAVLVLAAWADRYAAHGLSAEWRQTRDGRTVVVARTVEHRTTFPNKHRALSRYIQNWPFEAWGVSPRPPRLDARLFGTLEVPEGGPRRLRARSPNRTELRVDGRAVKPSEPIAPGRHEVEIVWRGRFQPEAKLRPEWSPSGHDFRSIPRVAFVPRDGPWTGTRTALWIGAPLLALLLGLLGWHAARAETAPARRKRWGLLATTVVLLLALGYRAFDYQVMPEFRENYDELFATWNGWSLLEEGTPRGWSLWPRLYSDQEGMKLQDIHYFSRRPLTVIEPYFEHPPLLHLMAGTAAHLGGASDWAHARLEHTRWVPILLSLLTTWLVIAVARRMDRKGPGPYLGGLLYAILPMIVLQGRVIKEEALLAPMALGSLLFYLRWRDEGERTTDLVGAAILAGAAVLAKIPGFIFLVALVMLVLGRGRAKEAAIAAGVGVLAASPLLVYAAAIDWELFWHATTHQATGRPSHFNLYPRFFDDPLVNHNLLGRPWLLFLWLASTLALRGFAPRDRAVIAVPLVLYVLGIGLSSGNWTFGWYLMPVYPFLCMGAGRFLAELWERPDLLRGALFVTLALMYGINFLEDVSFWKNPANWAATRRLVTIFLVIALAPYALAQVSSARPVRALARVATVAGLMLLVGLSGSFVARYDIIYETHQNFDRIGFFDR